MWRCPEEPQQIGFDRPELQMMKYSDGGEDGVNVLDSEASGAVDKGYAATLRLLVICHFFQLCGLTRSFEDVTN